MTASGVAASHVGVHVRDVDRSLRFYRDLLGLELVTRLRSDSAHTREITGYPEAVLDVAVVRAPAGGFVELMRFEGVDGTPVDPAAANAGTCHLAFYVDDLDALHGTLVAAGVPLVSPRVVPIPRSGLLVGAKVAYVTDPDGVRVELIESARDLDGTSRDA